MAIPDPHMEELQFMTYDPKPRACKEINRIPARCDFIGVLWCIDQLEGQPNRWCTAEVIHITVSPAQDVLASGVIRYVPGETWEEVIHRVEFLKDHKVRRTCDDPGDDEDFTLSENLNPAMDWRFAATKNRNSALSDDEDWKEGQPATVNNRTGRNGTHGTLQESHMTELDAIRSGHAALTVELEKVKREVLNHSKTLRNFRNDQPHREFCSSAGCVLQRLLHRLGMKFQAGLRPMSSILGKRAAASVEQNDIRTGVGLHADSVRVRVECNLLQFECIARDLKSSSLGRKVLFSPAFAYTQLPSQCSAAFRIMFSTFYDMSSFIGVTSFSDMMEMVRKCGNGPQGDILRILGTYRHNRDNPSSSASIFIGSSCGEVIPSPPDIETDDCNCTDSYPVLLRQSGEVNKVDRRFTNPLSLNHTRLPELSENCSRLQAFTMEWKRAPDLSSKTWSRSMTEPAQVFGWLEVTLPFIQTEGRYLCEEVGGLATDDVWEALLGG